MAEDKKSFLLYRDIISTVRMLPKEKQGELFMTILEYVNDEEITSTDLLTLLAFEPIKQSLKRDLKKYELIKKARQEAGRAGAKAKKEKQNQAKLANPSKAKQAEAKQAVIVRDRVRVRVRDIDKVIVKDKLKDRINEFKKQVFKFDTYSKEMLTDFFEYWSEVSPRGRKAKWEKQATFDINLRLKKWKDNQEKWEAKNPSTKRTASKAWRDLLNGETGN